MDEFQSKEKCKKEFYILINKDYLGKYRSHLHLLFDTKFTDNYKIEYFNRHPIHKFSDYYSENCFENILPFVEEIKKRII